MLKCDSCTLNDFRCVNSYSLPKIIIISALNFTNLERKNHKYEIEFTFKKKKEIKNLKLTNLLCLYYKYVFQIWYESFKFMKSFVPKKCYYMLKGQWKKVDKLWILTNKKSP